QLTDAEKKEVEEIFSKLDEIGGGDEGETDAATQALFDRLDAIFGTPKELSAEEQKQAEALEKQMEALFESIGEAEPTAEQEKQLDALSGQLDKLYGLKTEDQLTDAEKKEVEDIFAKLDETTGGDEVEGGLDAETQGLFDRLDAIFGTPKELNAEEQKQADALDKQLGDLFESIGEAEPTEAQQKQMDALFTQMDKLYGLKSEDQLTDAEKKEVEEIFAKLDSAMGGDDGFEGGEGQEDGDWGIDFGDETVSWANDGAEGGDNSWSNEDWGNDNWGSDNASGNSNSSAMVWGNESWSDDSWGNDGGVELTGLAAAGNDSVSFDWF
ncbi:MAG: hypothetical protein OIF57_12040, partial [Marinobacterium sp.]|nr:hypothetical protein [Marinobacterium sp.]